jgi:hypothetical protein
LPTAARDAAVLALQLDVAIPRPAWLRASIHYTADGAYSPTPATSDKMPFSALVIAGRPPETDAVLFYPVSYNNEKAPRRSSKCAPSTCYERSMQPKWRLQQHQRAA